MSTRGTAAGGGREGRTRDRRGGLVAAVLGVALACALAPAAAAQHKTWPKPAAGRSASGQPEVVFTFDDGPDPRGTSIILDALAAHGVRAIFFWVGFRMRGAGSAVRRGLVERAMRDGHLIGNHTTHHAQLCSDTLGDATVEIDGNLALYRELSGMPVHFFRVPYGARCPQVDQLLAERNLSHLHWDIDPQEWEAKSAAETADAVIAQLRHLDGRAVVLMHDTKLQTARAVPLILAWIAEENARRIADGPGGRGPIRVVSGSDLVAETSDAEVVGWLRDAAADLVGAAVLGLGRVVPRGGDAAASGGARPAATPTTARQARSPAPR